MVDAPPCRLYIDHILNTKQTGAGSTASMLGMADLGIASRNDMVRNADMIANLDPHHVELIADMDTGYGGKSTLSPHSLSPSLSLLTLTPRPTQKNHLASISLFLKH